MWPSSSPIHLLQGPDVPVTTDLCYVRWHGRSGPGYEYSTKELEEWAGILQRLPVDNVYGYFNNDVGAMAPRNALALQNLFHRSSKRESPVRTSDLELYLMMD